MSSPFHSGDSYCCCVMCAPPEPEYDNAPVIVPQFGFWRTLWLVLRGERLSDWSVLDDQETPE